MALVGVLKDMPHFPRDVLEGVLEPFRFVLGVDANGRDVGRLADEDELDPALEFAVTVNQISSVPSTARGPAWT